MHKGQARPSDDGDIVGVSFDSESGFALIPNVGDVVNVPEMEGRCGVYGVVKSRLFTYLRSGDEIYCGINIVVEDVDIDHGALIKE
nr:hypothetical protein [Pseudomonas sp. MWU12-2323]